MSDHASRCRMLRTNLKEDAFVAYNLENSDHATIRYLTGFTGEGLLVVSQEETLLLTDSRYTEQAKRETDGVEIEESRTWTRKESAEVLSARGLKRVAFPSNRVSYRWVETMREAGCVELVAGKDLVAELRRVKMPDEIERLKKAAKIADDALDRLVSEIRVGMTEAEVALRLEWLIRETPGADHIAFEMNVSTGPNTALNHYTPFLDPQPLRAGDLLLFDFGACVGGYRSDITRTFSVGHPAKEAPDIYDLVLRANLAALEAAKPGETGVSVDAVARELIALGGHGEHFGHGLGHGIGLEVHEGPNLSPRSEDTLAPGMVVTVEPGIYIPGFGGVRIEDDIVITEDGCDVITGSPKDRLIEVG
ncbi:MAG: Xaa-Pro peptidase family protein [Candidatus Bipolaricaulia bacterium]